MNRIQALESIKRIWNDSTLSLGEKILSISTNYYASGLDLDRTAAYLKTTQSELNAFLELSAFDEKVIELISEINPPKVCWTILSSGSEEEAEHALKAFAKSRNEERSIGETNSDYLYNAMIEIAGLTVEQKVASLSGDVLKHALKKAKDFGLLNDSETRFLYNIGGQRKCGKRLSGKQSAKLVTILVKLVENGAITHDSIDGDQEICDEILKAVEL